MSFFKKIGRVLKKVAAPVLGIGGALLGAPAIGSAIGGLFSAKGSTTSSSGAFQPDPGAANMSEWSGQQSQTVTGQAPPSPSLLSQVAPLVVGGMNYYGQQQANAANAQLAQQQMAFQASQTGTAYQRATADMQAAGLNPMLAYHQGGAASGSGAQATMGNELGPGANSALSALQTLQQLQLISSQIDQQDAQTDLLGAQKRLTQAKTLTEGYEPGLRVAHTAQAGAATAESAQRTAREVIATQIARETMQDVIKQASATLDLTRAQEGLSRARIPEAQARGDFASTTVPFITDGLKAINSAKSFAADHVGGVLYDLVEAARSAPDQLRRFGTR